MKRKKIINQDIIRQRAQSYVPTIRQFRTDIETKVNPERIENGLAPFTLEDIHKSYNILFRR